MSVFSVVVPGCYAPDLSIEDCAIPCSRNSSCPTDTECRSGYCARKGSAATCLATEGGGSGGSAGGGGEGSSATGGTSSGGTSSGGTSDTGGARVNVDAGSDADAGLSIEVVSTPAPCSGRDVTIGLAARSGTGPYVWSVEPLLEGWTLTKTSESEARLDGVPAAAGELTFRVQVTDANGQATTEVVPLAVTTTPLIDTELPRACAGLPYSVDLTAHGGDSAAYSWTITSDGKRLSGGSARASVEPKNEGSYSVVASVTDGKCTSDVFTLSVPIDADDSKCPAIITKELRPGCLGTQYPAQVILGRMGSAPADWRALDVPPGMAFDEATQTLSGVPSGGGSLTVELKDALKRSVQRTIPFQARQSCWLAYVSAPGAASDLHVFDPVLPEKTSQLSHTADGDQGVTDFAFSPDGRHLVYRSVGAGGSRLTWLDAPGWSGRELQLDGAVDPDRYAWSHDSQTLAVFLEKNGQHFLTGARARAVSSVPDGGPASAGGFDELEPQAVFAAGDALNSKMTWVDDKVVFHADRNPKSPRGADSPYFSALGARGFGTVGTFVETAFPPNVQFISARGGFFAVRPTGRNVSFFRFGDQYPLYTYPDGVVADPGGRYTARPDRKLLQVFQTTGAMDALERAPWVHEPGCNALMSWAAGQELIACEGDTTVEGDAGGGPPVIRLFRVDKTAQRLVPQVVRSVQGYPASGSIQRRRQFSAKGDWFAFTTDDFLYIASAAETSHVVYREARWEGEAPGHPYTELSFSPDGRLLLWQHNALLSLNWTYDRIGLSVANDMPLLSGTCSESFTENADGWCGSAAETAPFKWAPTSLQAAGMTGDKVIQTWDFTNDASASHVACSVGCANDFAFQPVSN